VRSTLVNETRLEYPKANPFARHGDHDLTLTYTATTDFWCVTTEPSCGVRPRKDSRAPDIQAAAAMTGPRGLQAHLDKPVSQLP
jgi:hypothetical protein